MPKIDEFKLFVKKNPKLISFVRNGTMSWQKFYEIYDLYGEENEAWNEYLKEEKQEKTVISSAKSTSAFSNLIEMAKNIDTNKLQDGISSIQKAIGLFGDMLIKDKPESNASSYTPRPIYRRFDD